MIVEDASGDTFTGLSQGCIMDRSSAITLLGTPVQLHPNANVSSANHMAAAQCRRGEEDSPEEERGFYHRKGCAEKKKKKQTVSRISLSEQNGPVRGARGEKVMATNKQTTQTEEIPTTTVGNSDHKTYIEMEVPKEGWWNLGVLVCLETFASVVGAPR